MATDINHVRVILRETSKSLMKKPNVVATSLGYKKTNGKKTDQLAIICSVDSKKAKQKLLSDELVPDQIENIPTDVFVSGMIYAQQDPKRRYRPAPGGVSIAHENVTAGTLGCLVKKNGKLFILSNNHILANSNAAYKGEAILQPAPYDEGEWPLDRIAELEEFVKIKFIQEESECSIGKSSAGILNTLASFTGSKTRIKSIKITEDDENRVDCALAKPIDQKDVKDEILKIGKITGVAEGILGMSVQKSGRTTGLTNGTIDQIDVTVEVSYGSNKSAIFFDQLIAGSMSQGGDSGSAILNQENQIIGLLFAGSDSITVINRIQDVFESLQVTLP